MARIASAVIDDIKQINIVDIISPYVELNRAGRNMRGLCPFHSEKTPSFHVHEDKGIFKCFGCNEAGDSITFIMKYMNLDYVDAVTYICENFGIELRYDDPGHIERPTKDLKLFHEAVLEYAKKVLFSDTGKIALDYLYKRGFDKQVIEMFDLGYLPPHTSSTRFEKQFSAAVMKESGIFHDSGYGFRCHFDDRILFPIQSATGACVGFSGRTMNADEKAKYKNSPETPIFSKRRELYNLHRAKEAMKDDKACYITEGYFDVIRMVTAGYSQTVAIMGTAFTREQVNQLKRYSEEFNLVLDGDEAGLKAMKDSRTIAIDTNIYPNVIFLPEGQDPDSYIAEYGRDSFDKAVRAKQDLLLYTIRTERNAATDDNKRFNRLERVKNMLQHIKDPYRKDYYASMTAEIFGVSEDMLKSEVSIRHAQTVTVQKISRKGNIIPKCEKDFISCVLQLSEEEVYSLIEDLTPDYFEDKNIQNIFNKIVEISAQGVNIRVLLNDPDIGNHVTDLIIAEQPGKPDIYETAVANKYAVQLSYYKKARKLNAEKLSQIQDGSEKLKIVADDQAILQKQRRIEAKLGRG